MNASDVLRMMDHKYALFGLFFAFHNRLQAVGDSFYEEITCKQFFLLACMNLYQEETDFLKYLFEGVSEDEVDSVYSVISKLEDNLKRMEGSLKVSKNLLRI